MPRVITRSHNISSISSGTMRTEDLIPCFVSELQRQKPLRREHKRLAREINSRIEEENYFSSEDAGFDLEELTEALQEYAPSYFYFGAHPGDGADYGYWLDESFQDDSEGIKVSDLSEIPADYFGEVLVINDHGNMSLYLKSRNRKTVELWAIV